MTGSSPARGKMKMRVTFERNYSQLAAGDTDIDGFGQKLEDWRESCTTPCWAWQGATGGRHTSAGEARTVTTDMPGMIVPLGTDVTEADRVQKVVDRAGSLILGAMMIDAVMSRATHRELRLRSVT